MAAPKRVSQTELAELLGLSTRQVHNLEREGLPVVSTAGRKSYVPGDAVRWYVDWKAERATRAPGPLALDAAKLRKLEAEARTAEIEADELEGSLIPLDLHVGRLATLLDRLRAKLSTMPSAHDWRFVGLDDRLAARAQLEHVRAELLGALREVADDVEADAEFDAERESVLDVANDPLRVDALRQSARNAVDDVAEAPETPPKRRRKAA